MTEAPGGCPFKATATLQPPRAVYTRAFYNEMPGARLPPTATAPAFQRSREQGRAPGRPACARARAGGGCVHARQAPAAPDPPAEDPAPGTHTTPRVQRASDLQPVHPAASDRPGGSPSPGARGRGPPSPVPQEHTGGCHAGGLGWQETPPQPSQEQACRHREAPLPTAPWSGRGSRPAPGPGVRGTFWTEPPRRCGESTHAEVVRESHSLGSRWGSRAGLPAAVRNSGLRTRGPRAPSAPLPAGLHGPSGAASGPPRPPVDGLTLSAPGDTGPGGMQEGQEHPPRRRFGGLG